MNKLIKSSSILDKNKSCLLIVDLQEKVFPVMRNHNMLLSNVLKLVKCFNLLNVPILYTEQYPKGLGATLKEIKNELNGDAFHKLTFSCIDADGLFEQMKSAKYKQIIVCGIESHVCVQQTVFDLIANQFNVTVPVNAITSRYKIDYKTAIKRMRTEGAFITTVESIIFELMQNCKIPEFKSVSSLIK